MENTGIYKNENFEKNFTRAKETPADLCAVRDIVVRISDKWSMLTLFALGGYGTLRFNELRKKIGDVSQRMLTVTVRNLEADGLVERKVYGEIPPRVEYTLTPLGHSLAQQLSLLTAWAEENSGEILRNRKSGSKVSA